MKKRIIGMFIATMAAVTLMACGQQNVVESDVNADEVVVEEAVSEDAVIDDAASEEEADATLESAAVLEDGVYYADFDTDSTMFHVNETCDGKGVLTVENGVMTIHISLTSQNITNLYEGLAEDAQAEGAVLLQPTLDTVTYSDGISEEVNGFDVAVPYLDEEFDLALIGTKETWYDHKVSVSNPVPMDDQADAETSEDTDSDATVLEDGVYVVEVTMEGGSGKASIDSPAEVTVADGQATALIVWSSNKYDYMLVDDVRYDVELITKEDGEEYSSFIIPVVLDENMTVIGDTTAMSTPHEVEYTLYFDTTTISE